MSYIKKEPLLQIAKELQKNNAFGAPLIVREIENAPEEDVVEVIHAQWKKVSDKYPRYACTNCNHLYNNKEYRRCPWCGAIMNKRR